MIAEDIKRLIENGESINIEFKESKETLSKSIYETVCAFNNRIGGHIILGVNDHKEIVGVNPSTVGRQIIDFVTTINNPEKMHPPLHLTPEKVEIDGKTLIYIQVPEGKQVCRYNGKIWDRAYEGDINVTNNAEQVYKLYARRQGEYFVNKVYPNFGIDQLDESLIEKVKDMAIIKKANHLWTNMTHEEILRSVNLILTDPETKKEGITLAAILLFGKDSTIMSVLPQHRTDAIFRVENKDRYDDRDIVATNIIDSYDRLMEFGKKHLNDTFILDGIVRVSARDAILREIISNTLVHRDYSSGFYAKLIIEEDKITVENSNLAHGGGTLNLNKFEPFSKNPSISKVFREIGLADELGSGMRNTYKFTRLYSGQDPIFEEGDIFRTTIPLKRIATLKVGGEDVLQNVPQNVLQNVPQKKAKKMKKEQQDNKNIIEFIKEKIKDNNRITREEIAESAGVSIRTIGRALKGIDNLRYVGSAKKGHWEFTN